MPMATTNVSSSTGGGSPAVSSSSSSAPAPPASSKLPRKQATESAARSRSSSNLHRARRRLNNSTPTNSSSVSANNDSGTSTSTSTSTSSAKLFLATPPDRRRLVRVAAAEPMKKKMSPPASGPTFHTGAARRLAELQQQTTAKEQLGLPDRWKQEMAEHKAQAEAAMEASKAERARVEELEKAVQSMAVFFQGEMEAARERYEGAVEELQSCAAAMAELRRELSVCADARDEAVRLAADAMSAAEHATKRAQDLSAELLALSDATIVSSEPSPPLIHTENGVEDGVAAPSPVGDETSPPSPFTASAEVLEDDIAQKKPIIILDDNVVLFRTSTHGMHASAEVHASKDAEAELWRLQKMMEQSLQVDYLHCELLYAKEEMWQLRAREEAKGKKAAAAALAVTNAAAESVQLLLEEAAQESSFRISAEESVLCSFLEGTVSQLGAAMEQKQELSGRAEALATKTTKLSAENQDLEATVSSLKKELQQAKEMAMEEWRQSAASAEARERALRMEMGMAQTHVLELRIRESEAAKKLLALCVVVRELSEKAMAAEVGNEDEFFGAVGQRPVVHKGGAHDAEMCNSNGRNEWETVKEDGSSATDATPLSRDSQEMECLARGETEALQLKVEVGAMASARPQIREEEGMEGGVIVIEERKEVEDESYKAGKAAAEWGGVEGGVAAKTEQSVGSLIYAEGESSSSSAAAAAEAGKGKEEEGEGQHQRRKAATQALRKVARQRSCVSSASSTSSMWWWWSSGEVASSGAGDLACSSMREVAAGAAEEAAADKAKKRKKKKKSLFHRLGSLFGDNKRKSYNNNNNTVSIAIYP